jgi:small subunit ribosomal protein S21
VNAAEFLFSIQNRSVEGETLKKKGGERMASVVLRPNESQDQLLKRFRKKVAKSGILSTVRRKRWFVSKSELRRIQKKKAIRRFKRRVRPEIE